MGRVLCRAWISTACLIAFFCFAGAAAAQSSETDRLLELLVKKGVVTQEEADGLRAEIEQDRVVQKARAAEAQQAPASPTRERPVTSTRPIRLSGYAQARYTTGAGLRNTTELRRARLVLNGNLSDSVSYRVQTEFARSPLLLDAHMDFIKFAYARFRIGQFKVPFSQENLTSSRDLLTIERASAVLGLAPGRDTSNNGRDIGFQLEGNIARGDGRPLFDYSAGLFNGAGINRADDNHRKDAVVRVQAHLARGFWIGGDYYNGASGAAQAERERSAAEFGFQRNAWTLQGEYIWARDGATHRRGSYTLAAYRFNPQWEGVFRFEELNANTGTGNSDSWAALFGVNWYFNESVKFQFNYRPNDAPARAGLDHMVLVQFQFQF